MISETLPSRRPEAPRLARAVVLVNANAGEVLQQGRDAFVAEIGRLFAAEGVEAEVVAVDGRRLAQEARALAKRRPDAPLIVAGGDGTVSRLLPILASLKRPVGVLPLGTLNLLARDLGLEGGTAALVAGLAGAAPRRIDLGEVNGAPFHSNVGLGFLARMAREREGARRRYPFSKAFGFAVAAVRALLGSRAIEVTLEVDGRAMVERADAVLITNNHFEGSPWVRPRLDEGLLEVHLLRDEGFIARLRAATAVWSGRWRELPTLRSSSCRRVVIHRQGRRTSAVAIDGEIQRLDHPVTVEVAPLALSVLAAEPKEGS